MPTLSALELSQRYFNGVKSMFKVRVSLLHFVHQNNSDGKQIKSKFAQTYWRFLAPPVQNAELFLFFLSQLLGGTLSCQLHFILHYEEVTADLKCMGTPKIAAEALQCHIDQVGNRYLFFLHHFTLSVYYQLCFRQVQY